MICYSKPAKISYIVLAAAEFFARIVPLASTTLAVVCVSRVIRNIFSGVYDTISVAALPAGCR